MWLGDGSATRAVLRSKYYIVIGARNPQKLGRVVAPYAALVATGKEAYMKLRDSAGIYGKLLELLRSHKWTIIKLATDDAFRAIYKQQNGKKWERGKIVITGVEMFLRLVISNGGSIWSEYYTTKLENAIEIAEKLKAFGLKPNIIRSGRSYVVYITMTDLLKLAEEDETIKKTIATYITEKAECGTPKQKEIAMKLLKRYPHFSHKI